MVYKVKICYYIVKICKTKHIEQECILKGGLLL